MEITTPDRPAMTVQKATRLVELSREAQWDYPTSLGRPVEWDRTPEWLERLLGEQGSLLAAVTVLTAKGHYDLAVEMSANVWRLWMFTRKIAEGREFLAVVLENTKNAKPTRDIALVLYGDGLFSFRQGNVKESRERNLEALKVAQLLNDPESEALAHLGLSRVDFEEGHYQNALSHATKARKLAGNLSFEFGQAPLFMHAQSNRMLRNYEEAASLFLQSVDLNRKVRDKGMVVAELSNLGFVEIHRGNVEAAERDFSEAEELDSSNPDPYSRAVGVLGKAAVAFIKGNSAEASSLLSESKRTLNHAGIELGPDDRSELDWLERKLAETGK